MVEYGALFIGLLIAGESILIPAVYLGITGKLSLIWVGVVYIAATIVSDTVWYTVGRIITHKRVERIPVLKRYHSGIARAGKWISRYGVFFLVVSKFIYGSRTATQILCGLEKIQYPLYMLFNVIGIIVYGGAIWAAGLILKESLKVFQITVLTVQIAIAFGFGTIIIMTIWMRNRKREFP